MGLVEVPLFALIVFVEPVSGIDVYRLVRKGGYSDQRNGMNLNYFQISVADH